LCYSSFSLDGGGAGECLDVEECLLSGVEALACDKSRYLVEAIFEIVVSYQQRLETLAFIQLGCDEGRRTRKDLPASQNFRLRQGSCNLGKL
jgi:hypothetical protein